MPKAIYIWQATGTHADSNLQAFAPAGHILIKFGITSTHLGDERLRTVASRYGFDVCIIHNSEAVDAYEVEQKLLKLGKKVVGIRGDGWTEFRYVSPADLVRARALVTTASAPEVIAEAREQSSAARAQYAYETTERQQRIEQVARVRAEWKPYIDAAQVKLDAANAEARAHSSKKIEASEKDTKGVLWLALGFIVLVGLLASMDKGGSFGSGVKDAVGIVVLLALVGFVVSCVQGPTKDPAHDAIWKKIRAAEAELAKLKAAYDAADTLPTNKVLALPNRAHTQRVTDVVANHHKAVAFGQKFEKVFFHLTLWCIAVPAGLLITSSFVYFRILGN
jgi:hypothetical protein